MNAFSCNGEFRVGIPAALYFREALEKKPPRQLDMLDYFYPGLLIEEIPSDGQTKREALFDDQSGLIRAVRYHGKLYSGGSSRVSQILGRLTGIAESSPEKERYSAEQIQIRTAKALAGDPSLMSRLFALNLARFRALSHEAADRFSAAFGNYLEALLRREETMTDAERAAALFPMTKEISEALLRFIVYQWNTDTDTGAAAAFTWVMLGSLLRGHAGRLVFVYLSSGDPRVPAEDDRITAEDIAACGSFYEGDDLDSRFPGIEWYCDRCGEHLNDQPGFSDKEPLWHCRLCGYPNPIRLTAIYNCEKEYLLGAPSVDREDFCRALRERTEELREQTEESREKDVSSPENSP